jgi:uncharacterized DUF497 family protein
MPIGFEWDQNKSINNERKHKVSFEEAKTIFYDEYARIIDDPDHSYLEERYIIQGVSNRNRFLIVSFIERGEKIRIISARKATKKERKQYEEFI